MSLSVPSCYSHASSRSSLPLLVAHPPGPAYASLPAPGFHGVPADHPFAQRSQIPGAPTSPKRKPEPDAAKRPQSAPPPPPPIERRHSSSIAKDRSSPLPSKGSTEKVSKTASTDRNEKGDRKDGGGAKERQPIASKPSCGLKAPGGERTKGAAKPPPPAAKFTPWSFTSTEPEFPPNLARPRLATRSRTMLIAELEPPSALVPAASVGASVEEKTKRWHKVKRALTGGNFRRSGRKPKKLELALDVSPDRLERFEKLDMTPREIEMSGGGLGRRWNAPMSAGYNAPAVYAGMPGGSHYDLRTSTIGYFPSHFVASAVDVGAVGGLKGSRTLSGVKSGAW